MKRKSLRTLFTTAVALVMMGTVVFGNTNTITGIYRLYPGWGWSSEDGYKFGTKTTHTITAGFQKTYEKGTAHFAISSKILGTYFPDAEADINITKAYSGINVSFKLDDTVEKGKTRYYTVSSDGVSDFKLSSLKDTY